MEPRGLAKAQSLSHDDLITAPQPKDSIQTLLQSSGDGGIFSQLTSNPLFTAVRYLPFAN